MGDGDRAVERAGEYGAAGRAGRARNAGEAGKAGKAEEAYAGPDLPDYFPIGACGLSRRYDRTDVHLL
ncbi:hypothetical protein GC101_32220 [Paenibacillus sp. LMG 31459]|uniref:Uncharacterized protein n=1 Tax=Paenibacillus phytohabitans TaxID=2654978 RepID=A0ABX1YTC9_9BACL|nr:hypothetical protein [Paenibacillus phytohabitans]